AAEPACPHRANEAAGGVKTMNNAMATFTEVLDMRSARDDSLERRSREAYVGSQSAGPIKLNFRCPAAVHEVKVRNQTPKVLAIYVVERDKPVAIALFGHGSLSSIRRVPVTT